MWTQPFRDAVPAFSPDGAAVAILAARAGLALKIQLLDTLTGAVRTTLEMERRWRSLPTKPKVHDTA